MSLASAPADPRPRWNHNVQFHGWILAHMPAPCESALDMGCGDGVLTRKLAERATYVSGIDASSEMIALARMSNRAENVKYVHCDILTCPLPLERFDFIAAVAVLHHLPLESVLRRAQELLRRGGVFAAVGLARNGSRLDYAFSAASIPLSRLVRLRRGWWQSPAPVVNPRQTFDEIRTIAADILPGAEMHRSLFFRYTMLWRKP